MKKTQKMIVACRNANGDADMFMCNVDVTDNEFDLGVHYDLAEKEAESQGYEAPFVCFDGHEQNNIARHVSKLDCPVPFTLEDKSDESNGTTAGNIHFGWDGISISLSGYSDCSSQNDMGIVAFLESWRGTVNLRAYADINVFVLMQPKTAIELNKHS